MLVVPAVTCWRSVLRVKLLCPVNGCNNQSECLSVVGCVVAYFLFFRREEIFYSFFLGSETCKLFDKALVVALAGVALAMCLQVWVGFLATFLVLLYWWTFYTSITAINTTVSLLWFQNSFTLFTFVKILAGICRHSFFFFVSAVGAGNSWFCYDFHIPKI